MKKISVFLAGVTISILMAIPDYAPAEKIPAPSMVFEFTEFNPDINPVYATPYGVFCHDNGLLVACYGTVSRISPAGKILSTIGEYGTERGMFQFAQCVAVDAAGNCYVLDNMGKKIIIYAADGSLKNEIYHASAYPMSFGVAADGTIFVPDAQKGMIYTYSPEGKKGNTIPFAQGELIALSGSSGQVKSLTSPGGMNYQLTWYDSAGNKTRSRSLAMTRSSFFISAFDLDAEGNFYGLDMAKNAIVREDASGTISWVIDKIEGSQREFLNTPYSISVTQNGKNMYVVDMQNKRVLRFAEITGIEKASGAAQYLALARASRKDTDRYLVYLNRALASDAEYGPALMEKAAYLKKIGLLKQSHELYAAVVHTGGTEKEKAAAELKKTEVAMYLDRARRASLLFDRTVKKIGPESAREHYQEAVKNYELVLKSDPANEAAQREYKKLTAFFSSGGAGAAPLDISEISLSEVFAAMYKYYNENPVGKISLKNKSEKTVEKIHAEISIREYMDYPTESRVYRNIKPGQELTIPLYAVFNNKILTVTEDTPLNAEIKIRCVIDGKEQSLTRNQSLNLFNRNAMTWDNTAKLASFITPRDTVVKVYARGVVQKFRNSRLLFMNSRLQSAVELFDSLGVFGISYVSDPRTPFTSFSKNKNQVDYIQYPRDTLRFKTGDCDDLTVLLCSLMENLGIETALATVPGHIFLLFNTGVAADRSDDISTEKWRFTVLEGTVWIPVEATYLGRPFTDAWEKGARQLSEKTSGGGAEITMAHDAWKHFAPVTLEDISWEPALPDLESMQRIYNNDINRIIDNELSRRVAKLRALLKTSPRDPKLYNSLGVTYARYGRYRDASEQFEKAKDIDRSYFSPWNNLGNLSLLENRNEQALKYYAKAAELQPGNAQVHLNLSLVYTKLNQPERSREEYSRAVQLSPSLKKDTAGPAGGTDTKAQDRSVEESLLWSD